jgi:hypothetical protein
LLWRAWGYVPAGALRNQGNHMMQLKKLAALAVIAMLAGAPTLALARGHSYSGRSSHTHSSASHHYGYQGGHYSGGHGSSHKGGHYVNRRTGNHYTHHSH